MGLYGQNTNSRYDTASANVNEKVNLTIFTLRSALAGITLGVLRWLLGEKPQRLIHKIETGSIL